MPRIDFTIQIDPEIKKEAEAVFEDLGLSFNNGLDLLLRQVIKERRITIAVPEPTQDETSDRKPSTKELNNYRMLFREIDK